MWAPLIQGWKEQAANQLGLKAKLSCLDQNPSIPTRTLRNIHSRLFLGILKY